MQKEGRWVYLIKWSLSLINIKFFLIFYKLNYKIDDRLKINECFYYFKHKVILKIIINLIFLYVSIMILLENVILAINKLFLINLEKI